MLGRNVMVLLLIWYSSSNRGRRVKMNPEWCKRWTLQVSCLLAIDFIICGLDSLLLPRGLAACKLHFPAFLSRGLPLRHCQWEAMAVDLKRGQRKAPLLFFPLCGDVFGNSSNTGWIRTPGFMLRHHCSSISSNSGCFSSQWVWLLLCKCKSSRSSGWLHVASQTISSSVGPGLPQKRWWLQFQQPQQPVLQQLPPHRYHEFWLVTLFPFHSNKCITFVTNLCINFFMFQIFSTIFS